MFIEWDPVHGFHGSITRFHIREIYEDKVLEPSFDVDNLAEPPKDLSDLFFIHWVGVCIAPMRQACPKREQSITLNNQPSYLGFSYSTATHPHNLGLYSQLTERKISASGDCFK